MSQSAVPDDLGEAGAALYRRVVDDLDEGLAFDALELERLEEAARLRDELVAMRADVRECGLRVTTPKGEIPNPMLVRIEARSKAIDAVLSQLSVQRPEPKTGRLSRAQRNKLRDLHARGVA
jgi:type II secretory pathway component PulJ